MIHDHTGSDVVSSGQSFIIIYQTFHRIEIPRILVIILNITATNFKELIGLQLLEILNAPRILTKSLLWTVNHKPSTVHTHC